MSAAPVCVHYEVGRVAVVFRPLWWQVSFRFVPGVSGRFVTKNPATSSHTARLARTAPTSSIGSHQRKRAGWEERNVTVSMSVRGQIRALDAQGVPGRQIARMLGVSRDSVGKYTGVEDASPQPPRQVRHPHASVVAPFEATIDGWLGEDRGKPRKQRHTAKRVFDRLIAENGYEGSYSPVQKYVKRWREAHREDGEGYAELEWTAGSAQVDFGQAHAVIAGCEENLHMLVVTFPHSNMRFIQGFRGETSECVWCGLGPCLHPHRGRPPSPDFRSFPPRSGAAGEARSWSLTCSPTSRSITG